VVALICEGYSSKQIAMEMGISVNTVANHRARLRKKTGATNTAELIRLVVLAGVEKEQHTP
jgi:two-component system, LuxR family, response regulator FixJ